jgi:NADH-quinone oxidoreductase subunit N
MVFTVTIIVSNSVQGDDIADFANLGRRSPYLAIAMVLALLSLGGVPPLAGFFGKFFLFAAAVQAGYVWLAIIGVLNAIVALYYYLTVIKVMYVDANEDTRPIVIGPAYTFVLFVTGIAVLGLGTLASPWWGWALDAASNLIAALP